jgi:leucyl aminopeptidase
MDAEVADLHVDVIVVPYFEDAALEVAAPSSFINGLLRQMRGTREVTGAFCERTLVPTRGEIPSVRVAFLGLGRREDLDGYRIRNALQFVTNETRRFCRSMAVLVDSGLVQALALKEPIQGELPAVARAVVEGVALGNYNIAQHKSGSAMAAVGEIEALQVIGLGSGSDIAKATDAGALSGEATNRARVLQWRPSNHLTPTMLAKEAEDLSRSSGLDYECLDTADMQRLGMGALLAVAQGSHEPPKLISMRHRPKANGKPGPLLAIVGKGITFDSGGLSLKSTDGMMTMKYDMSGAAAVIQAMSLIGQMQAPIEVIGIAPLTENMPGGGATRPGDVVTAMSGKTIEINNTDAEGRLVLADALWYAGTLGASHLVDVATLTGAVAVALGRVASAAMGTSATLLNQLRRAGALTGERIWELPLYPEESVALTCDIADLRNTSGSTAAGSIDAGIFLREFTAGLPWVHLDIAGSASHKETLLAPIVPRGPSGVMTRTLAQLPFEMV